MPLKCQIIFILVFAIGNINSYGQRKSRIPCTKGEYRCVCDSNLNVISDDKWKYVSSFHNGYASVYNNKRSGYVDTNGHYESNCPYADIGRFHKGYACADRKNKGNELLIINSNCEIKFSKKHSPGEQALAFFDSVIVVYTSGRGLLNYGVIDYNFNTIVPFDYCRMIKSSSERYYIVAKYGLKKGEFDCNELWGIYDAIEKKEVVQCSYKDDLVWSGGSGSCEVDKAFYKELEKYKITWPDIDQVSERINGVYDK